MSRETDRGYRNSIVHSERFIVEISCAGHHTRDGSEPEPRDFVLNNLNHVPPQRQTHGTFPLALGTLEERHLNRGAMLVVLHARTIQVARLVSRRPAFRNAGTIRVVATTKDSWSVCVPSYNGGKKRTGLGASWHWTGHALRSRVGGLGTPARFTALGSCCMPSRSLLSYWRRQRTTPTRPYCPVRVERRSLSLHQKHTEKRFVPWSRAKKKQKQETKTRDKNKQKQTKPGEVCAISDARAWKPVSHSHYFAPGDGLFSRCLIGRPGQDNRTRSWRCS